MAGYIVGKIGKTNTRCFDIRKGGSESVKTLYMYVVELKTLLKEYNEVEKVFWY